ncbi:MAG: flagellar hook capping FlgD N-terminal domain-containing protein [Pseudomonadota bacterium]
MTRIDAISSVANTATTQTSTASSSSSSATSVASDFDSFLRLLTAQLKNQDPLSPIDSTQFVEQLASFSSVEQQIESNRLLTDLLEAQGVSELETATQWIGKDVGAPTSAVRFEGEPVSFEIPQSGSGAASEIVISDSLGNIIYQAPLSEFDRSVTWPGVNTDGDAAPIGDYSVAINYVDDEGLVTDVQSPIVTARVTEARLSNGGLQLVLDNGGVIDPASISVVREPAAEIAPSETETPSSEPLASDVQN